MKTILVFLITISLFGCEKNNTIFFEDAEKNGLGIFSNKGNNLFSCYVNNTAWLTRSRIRSSTGFSTYEIDIRKQKTNTTKDTLIFTWKLSVNGTDQYKALMLHISVDSGFTYKDFKTVFNNKRIFIDSTLNGYFKTNINSSLVNDNVLRTKGNGFIFFQTAGINILNSRLDENIIAGLLSAKIGNNKITDGRFDHDLSGFPIGF